ncbi:hypothetical protein [Saccharopolyspora mangrovi]|uniref:Secreted protein n=1 Tax=Saccharopolyspora mangrovi TaxID=3082379 RepID=A0ABU6A493_9PSEU|nr:hypothetical protein [Saccharopolyspora sp. S2-29]MEB3366384.1 hypothetical protein [Saccharopolyspora sp. S2-29]
MYAICGFAGRSRALSLVVPRLQARHTGRHAEGITLMRNIFRAATVGASVVTAAIGLPLLVSAPAQATTYQCLEVLRDRNYEIGPKVTGVCENAAQDWYYASMQCPRDLQILGVKPNDATFACEYAQES